MHLCLHLGSGPSHKVYRKAVLEVDLEFSSTKVHNLCSRDLEFGQPGIQYSLVQEVNPETDNITGAGVGLSEKTQ